MEFEQTPSASISLVLVSILTLICFLIAKAIKSRSRLPPGPWNLPIIGSLPLLGSLPHLSLKKLSDEYGDIMYLRLGSVPFVVFSSASMAKEIFATFSLEFASKRPTIAGKVLGNDFSGIVFSMYTPQYTLLKKILVTHLLSAAKLKMYEGARKREQISLVRSLLEASNTPVTIREKLHALNMNNITLMLFGEPYSASRVSESVKIDEFVSVVTEAVRMAGYFNISDYIPSLSRLDLQGIEKRTKELMSVVNQNLLNIINDHRARTAPPPEPKCFVDTLLSLEGSEKLSDTSMISLIFDVLLGAVDTSALTAEWALIELLRHPLKLEKARLEIETIVGNDRLVEESDLAKLPYLDAIAKETSRVHPLVPIVLNREVTSKCTVKGYEIPAGMAVIINLGAILLDEKHWDKPLEFTPERFIEQDMDIFGQSYDLIPFGSGRRMCPGFKLGYDTLRLAVATMIQGFSWRMPEGGPKVSEIDMGDTYGLVCHKTEPLLAVPTPRLLDHAYNV